MLGRILKDYDDSTVDELAVHPAEFGKLSAAITLWKSQTRVEGEAKYSNSIAGIPPQFNLWKRQMQMQAG